MGYYGNFSIYHIRQRSEENDRGVMMAILDKIKEFGKRQFNEKEIDYDKTTDKELLNLRRQRRQQLERLEKEKLKDEVKEHNDMETKAFNQGKKLSEMKYEAKKTKEKRKIAEINLAKKKLEIERKKKLKLDKIRKAMMAKTMKQISAVKSKAKERYKTEFTMKQDKSAKRYPQETLLGSQQTMFRQPQNQDLGFFRKS